MFFYKTTWLDLKKKKKRKLTQDRKVAFHMYISRSDFNSHREIYQTVTLTKEKSCLQFFEYFSLLS